MRLLNTSTLEFQQTQHVVRRSFNILSHRWYGEETTLQLFEAERHLPLEACRLGNVKIRRYCSLLQSKGIQWCWVDTCCIDKSSSAELTEAINSMYSWYEAASCCDVYLSDVVQPDTTLPQVTCGHLTITEREVLNSAWFTRGFTLQELLAPFKQDFYDANWVKVTTRDAIRADISEKTGIPFMCFGSQAEIRRVCIAQRMSWMAKRQTTRVEDLAYCLMGIFDVNMPLLYGEGLRAFHRLQLEIIKISYDETIFAWTSARYISGMLAEHPHEFADAQLLGIEQTDLFERPAYYMTSRGLSFVPFRQIDPDRHQWTELDCAFSKQRMHVSICLARCGTKWVRLHCNSLHPLPALNRSLFYGSAWRESKSGGRAPAAIQVEQYNILVSSDLMEHELSCENWPLTKHWNNFDLPSRFEHAEPSRSNPDGHVVVCKEGNRRIPFIVTRPKTIHLNVSSM